MNEKVGSWIHTDKTFDPTALEERMDNDRAEEIYELERCVDAGRFPGGGRLEPHCTLYAGSPGQPEKLVSVIGTDQGIFGCMGLLSVDTGRGNLIRAMNGKSGVMDSHGQDL